jgi:hypothetical protein
MYSKQVKALTDVLESGFNLIGDLMGPLFARTIGIPDDLHGDGWDLFVVREEIVLELNHLGRSINVEYDSADVALATALISGAWEGHLLSTCIDVSVSTKAMIATTAASHVIMTARRIGLRGLRRVSNLLPWLRAVAVDLASIRAFDEVQIRVSESRGRLQAERAMIACLTPFARSSLLACITVAALEAPLDEDPRMVIAMMNRSWGC